MVYSVVRFKIVNSRVLPCSPVLPWPQYIPAPQWGGNVCVFTALQDSNIMTPHGSYRLFRESLSQWLRDRTSWHSEERSACRQFLEREGLSFRLVSFHLTVTIYKYTGLPITNKNVGGHWRWSELGPGRMGWGGDTLVFITIQLSCNKLNEFSSNQVCFAHGGDC